MRKIIITGGNEGIGFHMVTQFLKDGNKVAVLDWKLDNLSLLKYEYNENLELFECDIRDAQAVKQSVNDACQIFDGIDYAIHNACKHLFTRFMDTTDDDYEDVFNVNYYGGVNLTRAVLPIMEKQSSGRVIFTCSSSSVTGYLFVYAYASSKGALEALAKCLNIEYYYKNISFHILHPPLTGTRAINTLPVPDKHKTDPKVVGTGLAKHIHKKKFIICHSFLQYLLIRMYYAFPLIFGLLNANLIVKNSGHINENDLIRYSSSDD